MKLMMLRENPDLLQSNLQVHRTCGLMTSDISMEYQVHSTMCRGEIDQHLDQRLKVCSKERHAKHFPRAFSFAKHLLVGLLEPC